MTGLQNYLLESSLKEEDRKDLIKAIDRGELLDFNKLSLLMASSPHFRLAAQKKVVIDKQTTTIEGDTELFKIILGSLFPGIGACQGAQAICEGFLKSIGT